MQCPGLVLRIIKTGIFSQVSYIYSFTHSISPGRLLSSECQQTEQCQSITLEWLLNLFGMVA